MVILDPFFLFEDKYHNCTDKYHSSYNQKRCLCKFLSWEFDVHTVESCNHGHKTYNNSQNCKYRNDSICFDICRSIVNSRD